MSTKPENPSHSGDVGLIQRVVGGEESAVATLYRTHCDALFRFVYRRLNEQREDAEEVTQDAFLSAIQLARTYDGSCALFTWLCGVAKVRIADFYRRQGRKKRIPADRLVAADDEARLQESAAQRSFVDEVLDRLDAAHVADVMLAGLQDDEREALLLRYAEQLSVREMAALMRRSEKAMEHLLARARNKAASVAVSHVERQAKGVATAGRQQREVS